MLLFWFFLIPLNQFIDASYNATISVSYNTLLWENPHDYFLSYTLDISNWYTSPTSMDLTNKNFQYLASQLSPSLLRIGGGAADYTYYFNDITNGICTNLPTNTSKTYHCFTKQNLTNLMHFAANVGCKIVFGLSAGYPYFPNYNSPPWNSSNTEIFLNYIINNNYSQYFYGFELGNELNRDVKPYWQANAFQKLSNIINKIWPSSDSKPVLLGPDPDDRLWNNQTEYEWVDQFIAQTCDFIDGYTYHSYINSNQTELLTVNGLNTQFNWSYWFSCAVWNNCGNDTKYGTNKLIFAGEIAEHYHGGTNGLTNVYEDCLWYLDALGSVFKVGQNGFFRQQLYGNKYHPYYSLLDGTNKNYPYSTVNPDYWIAYLFNKLIGNKVLNAVSNNEYFRVYANCYIDNNGSIVVYYINLKNEHVHLNWDINVLGQYHVDYFISTAGAHLNTKDVFLNYNALSLDDNTRKIPPNTLNGNYSNQNNITIYMYSVGFIHFVDVDSHVCH
eukprot:471988_1